MSSVDGFQGREADAVVFSAVRRNARGAIGFVADPRRLNVGITRPRRALVVLGCRETLAAGSDDWRAYLAWLSEQGVVAAAADVLAATRDLPPPRQLPDASAQGGVGDASPAKARGRRSKDAGASQAEAARSSGRSSSAPRRRAERE